MSAPAPPVADGKKPATPPPVKEGKGGGDKSSAPGGKSAEGAVGKEQKSAQGKDSAQNKQGKGESRAPSTPAQGKAENASQQRFDRMAVRAKLAVSEPGDAVERDADAIADKVMRMPEPSPGKQKAGKPDVAGARGDEVRRKEAGNPPAEASQRGASASADNARELTGKLGAGQPLDAATRAYFEPRLGRDLSSVRIHSDAPAAQAAQQISARAFTFGNHIVFAAGEYQPDSEAGKRLLAHELAHVMQNDNFAPGNVVQRKKAADPNPKYADQNDISKGAIDPVKDKKARPGLETLKLPAIKARHAPEYKRRAGKNLKRPKGYDRDDKVNKPQFQTEQLKNWKAGITLTLADAYTKIGFKKQPDPPSVTFYGAKQRVLSGTPGELLEQLKVPRWAPDGSWFETGMQIDHIVEAQVGGEDGFENYELLSGPHNNSSGAKLSQAIRAGLRQYLSDVDKSPSPANVDKYLEENDIEFRKVEGGGESKTNNEKGAQFWSRAQIKNGEHLTWLKDDPRAAKDDGTKPNRFVLYSFTGNGFIDAFDLSGVNVKAVNKGRLNGIELKSITLNPGFDKVTSGAVGKLLGVWELPDGVEGPKEKFEVVLNAVAGKPYAGSMATLPPPTLEQKGASPITFQEIGFAQGGIFADGILTASHPLFTGVKIPVRWRGKSLAFEYTLSASDLQGKLPLPGITVDEASLTLSLGSEGLGAEGSIGFTVAGFGNGFLVVGVRGGKNAPELTAKGKLIADRKLFDQAEIELGYSSKEGFSGKGTLGITSPDKIKGIKSAKLTASYAKSVFNATGNIEPDIPGLKSASLSVTYDKSLVITGQLGIDDKVPGVEKADITVTVKQVGDDWKLAASGDVTPKLPGLSGAKLKFSYDEGFVLVEGEFEIKKGPLDGKVMAGVTNATVDPLTGKRGTTGSGKTFSVFGAADIKAEFIKDKLSGNLKLRLLPDGAVRVGGGLTVSDFEVFGQFPKDGGVFFDEPFSTPPIPIPGLGFSVGSVSVGVTFSASVNPKLYASIGPGKLTGITITITEFDPATVDFSTLEIGGGARFQVYANAGFSVTSKLTLSFSAAVASLDGSAGLTAGVEIPKDKPVLEAKTDFTYSQQKGLDLRNKMTLDVSPELKFRLFGEVSAKLNLLVKKVTVWSKDFTLAEANYKLPVGIKASGELGYNSKTGKISPEKPQDAIKIEQPKLDADTLLGVIKGKSAPPRVKTSDEAGQEVSAAEAKMCTPVQDPFSGSEQNQSLMPPEQNQSVMPKREAGFDADTPQSVDESLIHRLGVGNALSPDVRGYFEQRLGIDLGRVRIHASPAAAREAEKLSARAFTVGEHIAFAAGEFQPHTPEGQALIAHELAHFAQQQGSGEIVMRWPAVTRTTAHTSETPASIRGMSLSEFASLTQTQLDWATSTQLQADAAALAQFRDIQGFAAGPNIVDACGGLNMGGIIGKGIPAVYPALRKYTEGVTSRSTAWLRRTDDVDKAQRWGRELNALEGAWSAANLSLVMRAPDPVSSASPFEKLENPAAPELGTFISYLTACSPVLSADNGKEVDSFLELRREGAMPAGYGMTVSHVRNYHHFTKATLDGLASNEAFPKWKQYFSRTQLPLTVVLYPAVDHNGAFHRNLGLQEMVRRSDMLTIVVEGLASVSDYQAQLAPVAERYGASGRIQQAMVGGHGNSNILELAGSVNGAEVTNDSLGTSGADGTNATNLMNELTNLMSANPAQRRIVLDACLTSSHRVDFALQASPADAAADVNAAIAANPSLRDVVAGLAGAGANVYGSNSSFAPARTTFMTPASRDIGLSVPGDPDLIASKLTYVEFGTEPEGCMRAMLECWAADQIVGTHDCKDAVLRRIGAGRSTHVPAAHADAWRECIIQPIYALAANHYWANGEALRQLGFLAGSVFELLWPGHTSPASLNEQLGVLSGNAAHVTRLFSSMSANPHYAANPRIAVVIEQAWMQHVPARRTNFMAALGRYASCLEASADVDMSMNMAHVAALLTIPPPAPPAPDQIRLALMAAHHAPFGASRRSPLPTHVRFLRSLLGAGPTFPSALDIDGVLGGLGSESDMLAAIGRPVAGVADSREAPPAANVDTVRDATARNDFRVQPLSARGVVATTRGDLMVRSTPTAGVNSNIFNRLPPNTAVTIIGKTGLWYVIEQPGRSGFVARRYIRIVP